MEKTEETKDKFRKSLPHKIGNALNMSLDGIVKKKVESEVTCRFLCVEVPLRYPSREI